MRKRPRKALTISICAALFGATLVVIACSDEESKPPIAGIDPGRDASASFGDRDGSSDGGVLGSENDAGTDARDAEVIDAKPIRDANGPGEAGTDCYFNFDCQLGLRCECINFDCLCRPGPRGTGENGIDTCDAGEQCASSICIEGPPDAASYCTDWCRDTSDCTGMLPRCINAGFPEKICVPKN